VTATGKRRVVVLGSTGSIGRQALEVVRAHPDWFQVVGLAAGRDRETLRRQAGALGVRRAEVGAEAAVELAALAEADVVLNAIVGAAGLRASLAALESGKVLALANKESMVAGGRLCLEAAARGGGAIVPVDSEHAAVAQCLQGRAPESVARVVLTASGGPFRHRADLHGITPREALAHPTWSMGPKITIDSATLMNKGLEVIEAHHLFGLPYARIGVVVHPQSVVHGIVELRDGSSLLQAAPADMRLPIQAALAAPERLSSPWKAVDLAKVGALRFEPVDHERFPAVRLAYEAGEKAMSYPAALNAANEAAVEAFLAGSIAFTRIAEVVEGVLSNHRPLHTGNLAAVLEVDSWARDEARRLMGEEVGAVHAPARGRSW
jgi:1-deoxy-D-xylulose-5-phosphate reductoisomerase